MYFSQESLYFGLFTLQNGEWASDMSDITVKINFIFNKNNSLCEFILKHEAVMYIILLTDAIFYPPPHRIVRAARKTGKSRATRTGWPARNCGSQRHPWLTRKTSTEVQIFTGQLSFIYVFTKCTYSAHHLQKYRIQISPIHFTSPPLLYDPFQN
jgi:hypothetical protein